jgi:hypothetical protein
MKRFLLILALVLAPVAAFAQIADRDVLLTSDGTLYTIESTFDANGDTNRTLQLTIRQGNKTTTTFVPESLVGGQNWRPALAYDNDSRTLFVFWLSTPNIMSSALSFASYRDGKWTPAITIDDQPYHFRFNLRIGITRHVSTLQKDGTYADAPALLVHAVWWESTGTGEQARYALLEIQSSQVKSYELHDLSEFTSVPDQPFAVNDDFNPEILRHPAILPGSNSVDVVFGNTNTTSMNRVTLKPIADGRVHIPIGTRGGRPFAPPQAFNANWTGRISTIGSGPNNLVLYNLDKDSANYITYSNGEWSSVRTLALNPTFNGDAAVAAIAKMAASNQ